MNLLPFERTDLDSLKELQPTGWDNITPHFNFYLNSSFCFPMKVISDDKVIGIGASILHDNVAWLAHIIVHSGYRNKGIGSFITQNLINALKSKTETIYLIATDMGEPVYKKLGFIAEADYLFFNNGSFGGDVVIADYIKPYEEEYLTKVLAIDLEVYGETRAMHIRPFLPDSFVFINNNKVEGFYLPRFSNGLIVAKNANAGTELMKLRSKAFEYFIFPSDNKPATDYLVKHNYTHFRTAKRMRLGKSRIWQPENIYNRVSGQIG
jgi:hypothetical protein